MTFDSWWILLLPVIIAILGGISAVLADAWAARSTAWVITTASMSAAAALSVYYVYYAPTTVLNDVLLIDAGIYGVYSAVFASSALVLLGSGHYFREHRNGGGVGALVCFLAAGSATLASSADLLMTIILIELIALAGYGIVASSRTSASLEAALKYLVQGSVAAGFFALGLAVAFGTSMAGTQMAAVGDAMSELPMAALAVTLLMIIALLLKLGVFPFHSWMPDSLQAASPTSAAVVASIPKLGVVAALFLFVELMARPASSSQSSPVDPTLILAVVAVASIVLGNLAALRQGHFGRMLGYSSIAQSGYVLIGPATGLVSYSSAMVLAVMYAIATITAFLVAEALRNDGRRWDGSISSMSGLSKRSPILAATLAVAMLSLTGIPLTAGFWGKLLVFSTAIGQDLVFLAAVGLIGSVISFGYYGAVLRVAYFDQSEDVLDETCNDVEGSGCRWAVVAAVIGGVALVLIGVTPLLIGLTPIIGYFDLGS